MASFATPSDLSAFLQTTVDNTRAQLLLDLASSAMRAAVGQNIDLTSNDVVHIPAPEGQWLTLPQLPAVQPTVVKVDGVTVTDWTFDTDRLYRASGWQAWDDTTGAPLRVEVTYTHGYSSIPSELKRICLQVAARVYPNPSGLRSETIGSESYTYATETLANAIELTAKERRELRRALGLSAGAFTIDTAPPVYSGTWWDPDLRCFL